MVTNIWNVKQYRIKLPLSMFFLKVKPAPNNKDIFNIKYIQQCKIKLEPPEYRNCQLYRHTKNYCHLKPRCVKCIGDHLTNQCHRKERSSDVHVVKIILRILRSTGIFLGINGDKGVRLTTSSPSINRRPRRLTTLLVSMSCYRDSVTLLAPLDLTALTI
jgi:hypothetical protein